MQSRQATPKDILMKCEEVCTQKDPSAIGQTELQANDLFLEEPMQCRTSDCQLAHAKGMQELDAGSPVALTHWAGKYRTCACIMHGLQPQRLKLSNMTPKRPGPVLESDPR
ncbi:hypothetical protein BRADI_2g53272v3 [Brachypodium distachyon]|uniref:Uncharacterized protein n=1 Tax=Brachypodium distachyon TaxID=15368 RepID=A0A0Q3N171_BRADI|nr:hypothetical protein BRADI_2g53272v3 [Brachypodium distachyon]